MLNYFPNASLSITSFLCPFAFACSVISKTACALPTPAHMGFSLIVQGVEQQAIWTLKLPNLAHVSPPKHMDITRFISIPVHILHRYHSGNCIVWMYYLKQLFSHCLCTVILEVSEVIVSRLLERNHFAFTDHSLWTFRPSWIFLWGRVRM